MNEKQKKLFSVILKATIVIAVVGALFFVVSKFSETEPIELPPKTTEDQPQAIDTSDWMTIRISEFGIDFNAPKDWSLRDLYTGPDVGNEDEFWRRENVLGYSYIISKRESKDYSIHMRLRALLAPDTTIQELVTGPSQYEIPGFGMTKEKKYSLTNGLPTVKDGFPVYYFKGGEEYIFSEEILIKSGDVVYFFDVDGSSKDKDEAEYLKAVLEEVLSTIHTYIPKSMAE